MPVAAVWRSRWAFTPSRSARRAAALSTAPTPPADRPRCGTLVNALRVSQRGRTSTDPSRNPRRTINTTTVSSRRPKLVRRSQDPSRAVTSVGLIDRGTGFGDPAFTAQGPDQIIDLTNRKSR
jgi:hypothetical protein